MIDLESAKEGFLEYVNQFDVSKLGLDIKIEHCFRVMKICEFLTESMQLEKEKVEVAMFIGLFHDIGKIEQRAMKNKIDNVNFVDHGERGVEILKEKGFLRKFSNNDEYDNVIYTAIKNHSLFKIEYPLTKNEELLCKVIRDADKLDIFYELNEIYLVGQEEKIENSKVSPEVYEKITHMEQVERSYVKTPIDKMLKGISFVYDLNFKSSFYVIKNENYINKLIDKFIYKDKETMDMMNDIKIYLENYINEKIR